MRHALVEFPEVDDRNIFVDQINLEISTQLLIIQQRIVTADFISLFDHYMLLFPFIFLLFPFSHSKSVVWTYNV